MRGGGTPQPQVFFWGSRTGQPLQQFSHKDFVTTIDTLEYAHWAFASYKTTDNGKQIASAFLHGTCEAVSDGSYKDGSGTAAWMIQDMTSKNILSGTAIIPGHSSDQSTYRSELGGIFSIVAMIHNICAYYNITKGQIQIACDGLGPLTQCFAKYQNPSPSTAHFDMITSIRNMIGNTPIDWHWKHVAGHQDDKTDLLDQWAERNIQMDAEAKSFWTQLNDQGFQHSSCHLPGEGWTIWNDQKKLTSMNWSRFNKQTQSKYSTAYWQQENKLGNKLDTIDWNSIDKVRSSLPIQR